jgi:hypothetical protein
MIREVDCNLHKATHGSLINYNAKVLEFRVVASIALGWRRRFFTSIVMGAQEEEHIDA